MADNILGKMTLGKWIALFMVLAVVGFALLTQFTSFQIPKTLTGGQQVPTEHPGIQSQGSTTSRNNLDEVNDIVRGDKDKTQEKETGNEN